MGIGLLLVAGHRVLQDYVQGSTAPDGIYIPDAGYTIPNPTGGESYTHTFRIYNLRPRTLSLRAEPDCGCTGLSWQTASVAPFTWKNISATLRVKPGLQPGVSQSVSIAFNTDSKAQPYVFAFLRT